MPNSNPSPRLIRFGDFEVNIAAGELRKNGTKIKLQDQPFRVLVALLARADEVVTREELRAQLWPDDTYVDFDRSLNTAVNKLREALGDSASRPKLIETLPRRGYRFLANVEGTPESDSSREPAPLEPGLADAAALARTQRRLNLTLGACAALIVVLAAQWLRGPEPPKTELLKFSFPTHVGAREPVISPDGRHIAWIQGIAAPSVIWVQDLDQEEPREIAGTEGADELFWSAQSDFIGFATRRPDEVKRVPLGGGGVVTLCELPSGGARGGAWSPDDESILFAAFRDGALYEVPARGGSPKLLLEGGQRGPLANPHFLPVEDKRLLLLAVGYPEPEIVLFDLDTGDETVLTKGARPFFSPTGHILYQTSINAGPLWVLPFSIERLQAAGDAFPLAQDARNPSVSADGGLAYIETPRQGHIQLVWRDRGGEKLGVIGQPQDWMMHADLSPDGRQVAIGGGERRRLDIWLHDTTRPTKTRLTTDPSSDSRPIWSPSGDELIFGTLRAGNRDVYRIPVNGGGSAEPLIASPRNESATHWSPDGRHILYVVEARELWYLRRKPNATDYESVLFLKGSYGIYEAQFSPDGRFVAYLSDESGRTELYVTPFPDAGRKWLVSTNGARQPRWRRDGKELFYLEGVQLIAVTVNTDPDFSMGHTERLFRSGHLRPGNSHIYDVSPDGQRFVLPEPVEGGEPAKIRVVLNWYEEFRDKKN